MTGSIAAFQRRDAGQSLVEYISDLSIFPKISPVSVYTLAWRKTSQPKIVLPQFTYSPFAILPLNSNNSPCCGSWGSSFPSWCSINGNEAGIHRADGRLLEWRTWGKAAFLPNCRAAQERKWQVHLSEVHKFFFIIFTVLRHTFGITNMHVTPPPTKKNDSLW